MLRLLEHLFVTFRRRSPRSKGRLAYRLLQAVVVPSKTARAPDTRRAVVVPSKTARAPDTRRARPSSHR
jgi:hypothetical protein